MSEWVVTTHPRRTKGHLVGPPPKTRAQLKAEAEYAQRTLPHLEIDTEAHDEWYLEHAVWFLCHRHAIDRSRTEAVGPGDRPCLNCLKVAAGWPL